ncbi:MAG TPA: D-2-hydroxyacid dehydrogenase [Jatrophihabitantaceae bacterium]|nr:D-2-hydroxyacid dehydrogenase [Jatrophihabitantaceae bacterium]
MTCRLVVLPDASRDHARRLADDLPDVEVVVAEDAEDAEELLAGAEAAYGTLTPTLLAAAPALRWLQAPQAGPPPEFYFAELVAHRVVVTNLRDTYTDHVATHTVAMLLALARNIPAYARARTWAPIDDVLHLQRATVLVVGLGAVGTEVARQLGPFGATIIATDARLAQRPTGVAELHPADALDALLPRADAVVLTVPHTPATDGLMSARRLALLEPSAVLVNVGRGALVDLDDLVVSLRAGQLRAAAIDVVPHEPLPDDHPLWTMPQVLITPHVAGVGPETDERRYAVVRDNAERFAAGRALRNVVDKANRF